ncbi:MAG: asparaginase [Acidimicrobiia bacterium]|nr:MAG: asparaginase [Acidimicrobiia bacterium]
MRFARVRSGLAESFEDATVVALDDSGTTIFSSGDLDAPVFYRSAIKPFQALAAARTGLSLPDEHLAITCASHGGFPVHIAIVETILEDSGLTKNDLRCPPDRPLSAAAHELQLIRGNAADESRFHNCSGKHAGWLAACMVAGWDTETYLHPDHPIQRSVMKIMSDVTEMDPDPVGIDGCGAPTLRGSVMGLARAFSRLGTDDELAPMARAMTRFGALVADNLRPDGRSALWWGGPQKIGAEGLIGMTRNGITIAAKAHSGRSEVAVAAALVTAEQIGALPPVASDALEQQIRPPVIGAGRPVGRMELIEA